MVHWNLGTMGFSYKDWSGVFYPEGIAPRDFLGYYSQYFNAVEIDSTFYGAPRPEYVERWAAVTPPNFTISVKTPRDVTHELRLADALEPMEQFLKVLELMGDKLGVVLIQLPPDFAFEQIHTLAVFLRQLPGDFRYAIEFRHPSWHATATGQLLQNHNVGWVSTDYVHMPQRVYATTDFIYVRWIGRHGQYDTFEHERVDITPRLETWLAAIENRLEGVSTVYGFFNNDYAGHAPATCEKFKKLLGLPTDSLKPPQQGKLL